MGAPRNPEAAAEEEEPMSGYTWKQRVAGSLLIVFAIPALGGLVILVVWLLGGFNAR